jgi:hypothetical protein
LLIAKLSIKYPILEKKSMIIRLSYHLAVLAFPNGFILASDPECSDYRYNQHDKGSDED